MNIETRMNRPAAHDDPTLTNSTGACDVLIVSELPLWPLDQGFKVHGCGMARGLMESGVRVRMASLRSTPVADAPAWLSRALVQWPTASGEEAQRFTEGWAGRGAWWRHRIASHQGVEPSEIAGIRTLVRNLRPAAVVALGQHGPMMLRGLSDAFPGLATVWYAADDPVRFQLSCLARERLAGRHRLRLIALYGLLERSFGDRIDGVIGVSETDTAALARHTRIRHAATIPNGVDTDHYTPAASVEPDPDAGECSYERSPFSKSMPLTTPRSLVFWGRMDFEPNIDAVCWFADRLWPALRERHPDATWTIAGMNPAAAVQRLHGRPGVTVTGAVEDVRPFAHAASAVVLPMRCGGGIKNKLLEAAAMGRPIIASPRALQGLDLPAEGETPLLVCRHEREWIDAVDRLWTDHAYAARLGRQARQWVCAHHTWRGAAAQLGDLLRNIGTDRERGAAAPAHRRALAA